MNLRGKTLVAATLALAALGAVGVRLRLPFGPVVESGGRPAPESSSAARAVRRSVTSSSSPPTTSSDRTGAPLAALTPKTSTENSARLAAEINEAFNSLSVERLNFALSQLLPTLIQEDPPAAARLAETLTEPNLRGEVMYVVARLWGKKDAESALAWAGALPIEYERDAAVTDAAADLAQQDPARALALSARSFRIDQPNPVLADLAQRWAEKDFPAALAWTTTHSASPQRDEMLARLALIEARRDPPAAAQLALAEIQPGPTQDEAVISVLHQWAQHNHADASTWAARFPDGPLRDRAIAEVNAVAKFRLAAAP